MIIINERQISKVTYGTKVISAIYRGAELIWEGIRCCFGKGFWDNHSPWDNNCGWHNY